MGDIKTLADAEAIDKIKQLADGAVCLFCTHVNGNIISRPMATQQVDDEGAIWFFSARESDKNRQLMENATVHLMYMNESKQRYLSLTGFANIVVDRQKAKDLWSPMAKAWFEEGVDDPDLTLLKVMPEEGHYWDTKNGKLVSMIRIAVAAVTGQQPDAGVEGDLRL